MKNIFFILVLCSVTSFAEESKGPWVHESEVSIVSASGNTKSDTFSGKQKTSYKIDASKATATGSYLQGKSSQINKDTGVTTEVKILKWDAGLRYDYAFNETFGAFVGHGAESDSDAGYVQRDNSDLGGQYIVFKNDDQSLSTEAGFRYSKTYDGLSSDYTTFARLYAEYIKNMTKETSFKLWVEHLPNLKDSQKYLTNAEASVSVVLTSTLSLKAAYLAKYHNYPASTVFVEDKRLDSLFTTALVAKF